MTLAILAAIGVFLIVGVVWGVARLLKRPQDDARNSGDS
jgi:hypothetical protein